MKNNNNNQLSFENLLKKIEKIIKKLESGKLSLEESIKEFEYGIKLTKEGQKILQKAEQQIKILLEDHNNTSLIKFDLKNDKI